MEKPNGEVCFTWLRDYATNNSMTLEEMNELFTKRHIGGIIVIFILMVAGLAGNLMVMWIYGRKFKRSNYRTYTLWLAAMDLTNCCIGMPFIQLYHANYIIFPSTGFCKFGRFILIYTANASAFILIVIGIDRYRKVCCSLRRQISQLQAKIACCSVALFALLLSWPNFVLFGNHTFGPLPFNMTGIRCWEDDIFRDTNMLRDFYIGLSSLNFSVTIILLILYSQIAMFIYKKENTTASINAKKTTITLLTVTAVYFISALPNNVTVVVLLQNPSLHCHMTFAEGFVLYTFVWTNLINNSANPFIYGFWDRRFKREVELMILNLKKKLCNFNNYEN